MSKKKWIKMKKGNSLQLKVELLRGWLPPPAQSEFRDVRFKYLASFPYLKLFQKSCSISTFPNSTKLLKEVSSYF